MTLTLQNALRSGPARTLTRDYGFHSTLAGMPGYSRVTATRGLSATRRRRSRAVWVGYDDSRPIGSRDVAVKSGRAALGRHHAAGRGARADRRRVPCASRPDQGRDRPRTGSCGGLAGLAPAPGDIFVYLKKEQVDAAGSTMANSIRHRRNGATGSRRCSMKRMKPA